MFFLTFIIPLRHIHDVGDILSPRREVLSKILRLTFCILEEWDAGYGGLVSNEHPWDDLVTVHAPPLAKDAEDREKNNPVGEERNMCHLVNNLLSLLEEA